MVGPARGRRKWQERHVSLNSCQLPPAVVSRSLTALSR